MQHEGGRAFLGTYQKVALLEPGRMVILEPNRRALIQQLNPNGTVKNAELFRGSSTNLPEEIRRTVAVYQSAAELFAKGLSKEKAANAE